MSIKKIRNYFGKINKTKIIFILGIAGILLIFLSEIIPSDKVSQKNKTTSDKITESDDTEIFRQKTENELTEILEKINGVGECRVMVTVEGTTEYVYAENVSEYNDSEGDRKSDKHENDIVMVEKDGQKQALIKKIIKPQINGVVVVCQGGGNVRVCERVLKAVSIALNLSTDKICVECKS